MITIRTTSAYKAWFERMAGYDAERLRSSVNSSDTADRAFAIYARDIGFKETPPKR